MRATLLRGFFPFLGLVVAAGCQCGPFGVEDTRFTCTADADCLDGFECRDLGSGKECVRPGTGLDAGGVDAGEVDAGAVDAGEVDAGEVDAGEVDAGDVDAGDVDAGETDAGQVDAGPQDPPTRLRFATAPQTVVAGGCSQIIAVETVGADGGVRAVVAATDLTLGAAPGGVTFFTASGCAGAATTTVTVGATLSSVTFYASASDAGAWTLSANAAGLTGATQSLTGVLPPNSLVFTSTPPGTLRAGTCQQATIEARRGAAAVPVAGTTTVGLTVAPTGAVRFFSDASCANAITTTSIPSGFSTTSFFYKPLTGGGATMTANAPFGTANQALTIIPLVRRGNCQLNARVPLPDGGATTFLTVNCPVSPSVGDLSKSILMWQTTADATALEAGSAQTRCRLSSTTNMACTRRMDGDVADVHFQVAEVPSGVAVQRATSSGCASPITLGAGVNLGSTFVLKGAANNTTSFDDEDAVVAFLESSTTISLTPPSCDGYDVQAVDVAGITVLRGVVDGGMPAGASTLTVTGLPNASMNRAVLLQPGTTFNGSRPVCNTLVRASLPSNNSIALSRGAGDAGCPPMAMENIAWERLDFGSRGTVREYTVSLGPGDTSQAVTITPVDTTRTLVFASSQASGGQGAGESDHDGPATFTEGVFRLVLTNSTSVTVTRGPSTSSAAVTFYVVELNP